MAKKSFVLDTNILLHDSQAIFSFDDNNIIIPLIVLEELDRHKDRQDEVGKNARDFSRTLSSLIKEDKNIKSGIKLHNGGILKILSVDDVKESYSIPSELDSKS